MSVLELSKVVEWQISNLNIQLMLAMDLQRSWNERFPFPFYRDQASCSFASFPWQADGGCWLRLWHVMACWYSNDKPSP